LDPASVEQVQELAAKLAKFALGQPLDGSSSRHRARSGLEHQLDAPIRGKPGRGTPQDVCIFRLELRKGRMIGALQFERTVDDPQGGKMKLRSVG
jgi:hypothetical protein